MGGHLLYCPGAHASSLHPCPGHQGNLNPPQKECNRPNTEPTLTSRTSIQPNDKSLHQSQTHRRCHQSQPWSSCLPKSSKRAGTSWSQSFVHVVGLEGLHDEVIGVVTVSGHLLLEHLDHVLVGAGTTNLTKKTVELRLGHEDTNVVEGSTEIIFVQGTVLVDVHQLEAVLVHLELLLGETSFILALAHFALSVSKSK